MAKYFYSKYKSSTSYVQGAWRYRVKATNTAGAYEELKRTVAYSMTYTFSATEGYRLSGTIITRDEWSLPLVGGYYLGSYSSGPSRRIFKVLLEKYQSGSDTLYYVDENEAVEEHTRGTLVQSGIVAENGTYPTNGRHSDGYWYVRGSKAFPDFKVKADGQLRTSEEGWVKINGVLRPIEQMWVKVNGIIKEV